MIKVRNMIRTEIKLTDGVTQITQNLGRSQNCFSTVLDSAHLLGALILGENTGNNGGMTAT